MKGGQIFFVIMLHYFYQFENFPNKKHVGRDNTKIGWFYKTVRILKYLKYLRIFEGDNTLRNKVFLLILYCEYNLGPKSDQDSLKNTNFSATINIIQRWFFIRYHIITSLIKKYVIARYMYPKIQWYFNSKKTDWHIYHLTDQRETCNHLRGSKYSYNIVLNDR